MERTNKLRKKAGNRSTTKPDAVRRKRPADEPLPAEHSRNQGAKGCVKRTLHYSLKIL